MAGKRRFKDDENESTNKRLANKDSVNFTNDLADDVPNVVRDLVSELVNTTDSELNSTGSIDFSLDDSFKLNYDFNLIQNDALYNSQYDNSFTETATSSSSMLLTDEHNYANVPTTSSSSSSNNNQQQQSNSSRSIKGALKSYTNNNDAIKKHKKSVKFKGVTVFYFPRNQGGSTVPSQGGSTLGMEMNHVDEKNFTLDAHQEEKRLVHLEILLRQKRYEKMYQKQQQGRLANQSDSDDSLEDISDSELEFDSWYFLQPVPVKQRRALLRESGVNKIDSSEKEECREIRLSREFCGCECSYYCDPETCLCSLNGIKCQVDRLNFPCGCYRESCNNVVGRNEFNALRVRTHFIHTIMRLELEKKNESQSNDESLNPATSQHLKATNSSSIELNRINTPFTTTTSMTSTSSTVQSMSQQQFITNTMQVNELYSIESSNNANILNCNEAVNNLPNNNYDIYDSGSSSYSESCTSEDLDCANLATVSNGGLNTNELTFNSNNLTPFPTLNSSVPPTSTATLSYDNQNYHQPATVSNFIADQSFRYYSSTSDPNQMINHHLNPYYYQDSNVSLYNNNLTTVDCYSTNSTSLSDHSKSTINNDIQQQQSSIIYNETSVEPFVEHHYTDLTDLSQSIVSSKSPAELLFATTNSTTTTHFDHLDCTTVNTAIVNSSSDDSSSSAQSLNANLDDNYLTSSESLQNDNEDNFGEIIKNTVLESVTA